MVTVNVAEGVSTAKAPIAVVEVVVVVLAVVVIVEGSRAALVE